ncbi:MAG: hypothetical protein MJE68_22870 [Proteobacteria bacterium]|nr:hypothetical protein [Pseudomonadota bacterium]
MAFLYRLATLPLDILRGILRLMFSIAKFIVLIAVVGLVFGLFWLARLGQGVSRPSGKTSYNKTHGKTRHSKTDQHNPGKAVDLYQCPHCKAWVAGACETCGGR